MQGGGGAFTLRAAALLPTLVMLLGLLMASCGYHNGIDTPLKVPEQFRKLAITEVRNPTTQPGLGPMLRSFVHDEFSKRGHVEWVERDQATGLLQLTIEQLSNVSREKDAQDRTLKFEVRFRVRARILSPSDSKPLWDSGIVYIQQSYFENQQAEAESLAVELAARSLADRLGDAF